MLCTEANLEPENQAFPNEKFYINQRALDCELLLLMQMVGWSDQLEAALMKNTLLAAESSLKVFLKCWTGWCYEKLTNRYKKCPNMSDQGSKWDEKIQRSGVSAISNVALPSSHGFSLQLSELYGSEAIEAIGNCSQSNSTWEPKQVFARCCFRSKHIAIASKMKSGF